MSEISRVLETGENQITQKYGGRHGGIDIVKNKNQLDGIIAHTKGCVTFCQTGYDNQKGLRGNASYGNCVKIKHPNGYSTIYAHLEYVTVEKGDDVVTGQKIGYMGNSGNSYGAHLHFEVRDTENDRMDPEPFINDDLPGINIEVEKVEVEKEEIEKVVEAVATVEKEYTKGRYVVTASVLNVREEASIKSDKKKFEDLTANAQKQVKKLSGKEVNGYVKGIVCDISKISENWGKTPSGWICLDYCEKK